MWATPVGAEFRDLLDKWDTAQIREEKHNQIRLLIDGQNFVMFFEKKNDIYGATEQHRVVFSKMVDPDEETTDAWRDEAHFMAINLSQGVQGKPSQEIFYLDDLDEINVISKEQAFKELKEKAEEAEPKDVAAGAKAILHVLRQAKSKMMPPPQHSPGMPMNQGK